MSDVAGGAVVQGHADVQDEGPCGDYGGHRVVGQFEKNSCRQPLGRLMRIGGVLTNNPSRYRGGRRGVGCDAA